MASNWAVIVPQAGTNLISNPSMENGITGYGASNGATLAQTTETAAFGGSSLRSISNPALGNSGILRDVSLVPNTRYVLSFYALADPGQEYAAYARQAVAGTVHGTTLFTTTGAWQRVEVAFLTPATITAYTLAVLLIRDGATYTLFTDGWQLEIDPNATLKATTYIDGDQPGCQWDGARQASLSTRSGQWRSGGKIVDLETYGLIVTAHNGVGSGSYTNVNTDNGIIGGATFQRSIVQPRPFSVSVRFTSTSATSLHANRQALLDAVKPNLVSPQQPISLRYTGSGKPRIIHCHYEAGLDDGATYRSSTANDLRFIAYDPYFYAEYGESKWFSAYDQVTDADYVLERAPNGTWHSLAGGLSSTVRAAIYDSAGNLYVAGDFITAYNAAGTGSPVTVNRVAKWDGTSWTALGAGMVGPVYALALDTVGQLFAGGPGTNGVQRWNGTSWATLGTPSGTRTAYALVYNATDGKLYVGGDFINWDGITNATGIVSWNGANFAALGTGINAGGVVNALALDRDGSVIAGGTFSSAGGVTVNHIARWRPSSGLWNTMGSRMGAPLNAIAVDAAGIIYAGGTSNTSLPAPYLNAYTSHWYPVGDGVNGSVDALSVLPDRRLLVGGAFTTAGGLAFRDRSAVWNGSAWEVFPVDLPGSARVYASAYNIYTGELALGYNTSGTAVASNITDVTINNPGTEDAAPLIFINHAGTLETIENVTTGKKLFFDLRIQAGETLWLDLSVLTPQYLPTFVPTFNRNGPRLWSIFRGDITRYILPNSDLASFRLLPGDNTILVKTRNAPAGASFNILFRPRYLSSDA